MSHDLYSIELASQADHTYSEISRKAWPHLRAGNSSNAHVKRFRIVRELLKKIIPHDPFNPARALSGELRGIFRVKKGRMRVAYIGSFEARRITVVFISDKPRKEGDKHDPYALLAKLVKEGKFDEFFRDLELRPPRRQSKSRVK